ncbi:secreted protein, partial [Colletotrichum sojae]
DFPRGDQVTLKIAGSGKFTLRVRIPEWTSGAEVTVTGEAVTATAGTYASVDREWADGDTVVVKLPMKLYTMPANDDPSIAALAFGPVILSGNYGSETLSAVPSLDLDSVKKSEGEGLAFTATAGGKKVRLGPFYDAQGFNYNVYWSTTGALSA